MKRRIFEEIWCEIVVTHKRIGSMYEKIKLFNTDNNNMLLSIKSKINLCVIRVHTYWIFSLEQSSPGNLKCKQIKCKLNVRWHAFRYVYGPTSTWMKKNCNRRKPKLMTKLSLIIFYRNSNMIFDQCTRSAWVYIILINKCTHCNYRAGTDTADKQRKLCTLQQCKWYTSKSLSLNRYSDALYFMHKTDLDWNESNLSATCKSICVYFDKIYANIWMNSMHKSATETSNEDLLRTINKRSSTSALMTSIFESIGIFTV